MLTIFKRSTEVNLKIETYLNVISDSLNLFEKMVQCHLLCDEETFMETYDRICMLETEADQLEADIKVSLYKYLLLPDTRADVLSIIKSLDNVIDLTEMITKNFYIQKPQFPGILNKKIISLTSNSTKSARSLLQSVRSFFNEAHQVNGFVNEVNFFEHETDLLQDQLSNSIFNENLVDTLAEKLQLNQFIADIASISDEAEIIGSKLTIFTIKREI